MQGLFPTKIDCCGSMLGKTTTVHDGLAQQLKIAVEAKVAMT
jgi:hypothetical protein